MSTKIQINSLAALERLIGNDNEIEIEIRNSIVQEFAKKHLKSIAHELDSGLLNKELKDAVLKKDRWSTNMQFTDAFKGIIQKEMIEAYLSQKAREVVASSQDVYWESVNNKTSEILDRIENGVFEDRVKREVNKKYKQYLDNLTAHVTKGS